MNEEDHKWNWVVSVFCEQLNIVCATHGTTPGEICRKGRGTQCVGTARSDLIAKMRELIHWRWASRVRIFFENRDGTGYPLSTNDLAHLSGITRSSITIMVRRRARRTGEIVTPAPQANPSTQGVKLRCVPGTREIGCVPENNRAEDRPEGYCCS